MERISRIAPSSLFALEKFTQAVKFVVDESYEAVDPKNPDNIYPVTCKEVNEQDVVVHWDGYGDAETDSYPLDTLDIFPSGWCEANGYPLSTKDDADVWPPQSEFDCELVININ